MIPEQTAMPTCRVQVIIPYTSGVPSDVITNTWHFDSLDGEPIDNTRCGVLFSRLATFYTSVYTAGTGKSMAAYINESQIVMKAYDLSDPKPRTAVRESVVPITVGTKSTGVIPSEASVVLSYHTEYESGINKASQRGRVYLGGLGDACISPSSVSRSSFVSPGMRTAVTGAADTLAGAVLADDWGWVVYSEKLSQSFAVAGGWVDDAIDTQRRRGQAATTRTTFSS